MRYVCPATLVAFSILAPASMFGQLTISNYQLVNQTMVSTTTANYTYSAQVNNTGVALASVTANVTSLNPFIVRIEPNAGTLTFGPVPANGHATSLNTFTILVNRQASPPFTWADLLWSFQTMANAPVANAGPNQPATVHQAITLNGAGSTNPSGVGTLTYQWAFVSRPAGSSTVLGNQTGVNPTFTVDVAGTYIIQLTVSNGIASSTSDVTVTTTDTMPVANAGPNQTVAQGATVTLNGSGSSDSNSNPMTFQWTLTSVPNGSTAFLAAPNAVFPTFVADKAGVYTAALMVNDGVLNSNPATVTISTVNSPPVANAGPAQVVNVGATVQLDGSGSTDVDGDTLTYQWSLITLPTNSHATLSNTTAVKPTFVADLPGTYVAQLTVFDGLVASNISTVTITTNPPLAPTANAGSNQSVVQDTTVQLSGGGTDPQGYQLTYLWSFTSRPLHSTATLSGATTATPTFLADQPGVFTVQLVVNDGFMSSNPALTGSTVTISTSDLAPTANAGPNQNVTVGSTVTLNGSGSADLNGDSLTYSWTFNSRPSGSAATLSGANTVSPTFVPDVAGVYVAQLIVTDTFGTVSNPGSTVTITATQIPASITASSGTPQTAATFTAFALPLVATVKDTNNNPIQGVQVTFTAPGLGASGTFSNNSTTIQVTTDVNGNATAPFTANGTPSGTAYTVTANISPALATAASFTLTNTQAAAASISVTSGSPQSAQINAAFAAPLVVTVLDATSHPVPNATVTFMAPVSGASGSFAGSVITATTNASGVATSAIFTANGTTGGPYIVTATVSGVGSPASFALTNTAQTPASITMTSGSPQNANANLAFSAPLVVTVLDAASHPVPNVVVTFTAPVSNASGSFAGGVNTATTNASGVATSAVFTANATAGGPYTVIANVTPALGTPASFSLTNNPAVAASITATSGTPQSAQLLAAFGAPLVATVLDASSHPVSNVTVTFTAPVTGASGTFAGGVITATTNASGIATSAVFTANSTTGGPYLVTAAVSGVSTPASFSLTNTAQVPASIGVTSGSPQSAQILAAFSAPLVATVLDANSHPVPNVTVTFLAPGSGASGTFAGSVNTATTNASGVATSAVFTANSTTGGPYLVNASVSGVSTPASFSLTNTAQTPASIAMTSGSPQNANVNLAFSAPLVATVLDAASHPVPNVVVTFTAPASNASGSFAGGVNTATTNSSGIATSAVFTANATVGGPYNVTANVSPALATPATFVLTNNAAVAASITATSGTPQSVTDGAAFAPFVVLVKDSGGNPVNGVTVTFAVPNGGPTGTFAGSLNTAVTNSSGVATSAIFTANSTAGAQYTVAATVSGVSTPANFLLTNTVGAAASITATSGTPQSVANGTAYAPFVVTVKDSGGNALGAGTVVTFTAPTTGPSGTFAAGVNTATTNASGVATSAVFTANTSVGAQYTVSASATGVTTPASFLLTNIAGAPASIAVTSGSGQSVTEGTQFASLVATVKDSNGNVVTTPVNVTFTAPALTGASGTFANGTITTIVATNASGVATATAFTANGNLGGPYNVTAAAAGVTTPATFALTNTIGAAASVTATSGGGQTTTIGNPFPAVLVATVKDSGGNPIPNVVVTFTAPALTGASGTFANGTITTTATTSASGAATSTAFTANTTAGTFTVNATAPGVSTPAAFSLTSASGLILQTGLQVGVGASHSLNVSLSTAPTSSVIVTLTSSNPSIITLGPSQLTSMSISIPALSMTPAAMPTVNGMAFGSAVITATATGYPNATTTVVATDTISFSPTTVTISGDSTVQAASYILLSTAAPSTSSITLNLTSSNTAVATVPSTVIIPASGSNVNVPVTGVSGGTATITASNSSLNIAATTLGVTVNAAQITTTQLPTGILGAPYSQQLTATGGSGTYTWTLISGSLPTGMTLSTGGLLGGSPSATTSQSGTSLTFRVTDTSSPAQTATATLTLLVVVGTPASITSTTGAGQSTTDTTAFGLPLVVTVKDVNGYLVPNATVTFTAPSSGASGTFAGSGITATAMTNSTGVATSPVFTANSTLGGYTVNATVSPVATAATFNLTNTIGSASTIAVTSGTPQNTTEGTNFANPLVVIVKDVGANLISGATITYTIVPNGSATGTFVGGVNTAVTTASGLATSAQFTAGGTIGTYTVTAASGSATGATFTLTNNLGSAASITVSSGTNNQSAAAGSPTGAAFAPLVATVKDSGGNVVPGVTVTYAAPAQTLPSVIFGTNPVTTDSNGNATITATANAHAGPSYTVTATATGVATPASFTLTNTAGAAASIAVNSGSPQSVADGTAFAPLVAIVKDSGGNPVNNATVTFTIGTASGATASFSGVNTATTNASGLATSAGTLTANNVDGGPYTVSAAVTGVSTPASFLLTNVVGSATAIAANSGTPQSTQISTAFGAPLVAKVVDQGGNPVSGVVVTFLAPASGASGTFANTGTNTTTATTGSTGLATSSTFTANGTDNNPSTTPYVVTATATGVSTPASFSLTNLVGSAASIAVNGGSGQGAQVGTQFTNPLSVIVKDSGGNPVSGVVVTFTAPSSPNAGATFVGGSNVATATTGVNGVAATSVAPTANSVEGTGYTVTATANPSLSATFTLTNNAGAPASITLVTATNNQSVTVGTAYAPLQVTVKDGNGNLVPGITVIFTAVANGAVSGTFGGNPSTTALTNSSGVATATLTANTKAGTFTVTAAVASPALSTTFNLTSTAGVQTTIAATGGATQNVGINTAFATPLLVTVSDSNGNPVSGVTVTFAAPAGSVPSATFTPSVTATTGAAGTATVTATANSFASATAYTVTATATGVATPASFSLTNNAGPANKITILSGNTQQAGITTAYAALSVTVTDAGNNPVPSATVTFTPATVGGATATFAGGVNTATTNASGVATTAAALTANNTTGTFTVAVTSGSATPASFSLTNIAGPPATITLTAPTTLTAPISTAFGSMVATVKDAGGNLVPNTVVVTFTANTVSGATGTFSSGATATVNTVNGIATAPAFTAGTVAGTYSVTVAATTGTAPTQTFTMTNAAGTPASFTIGTGNNQSVAVGSTFATAMTVTVKDAGGNLVAPTSITFTAPAATGTNATGTFGSSTFTTVTTASGIATVAANALTAGTVAGPFSVTVTAATGNATPVTFSMTNLAGSATSIVASSTSTNQTAQIAVPFANPLVVTLTDSHGNGVSGQTVTFTAPASTVASGTFANGTNTTTATTGSNGVATSSVFTANTNVGGPYNVTANISPALGTAASFALTNAAGTPATITKTASSDNQSAMVGSPGNAFTNLLVVTVKDAGGNNVNNAPVTFTAPASTGPSGTFANGTGTTSTTTNSSGVATSTAYTTNTHAGADGVVVSVATGNAPTQTFNLTNTPGSAATVVATSGGGQSVKISTIFGSPLVATVTDAFSNPVGAGTSVTFSVQSVPQGGQSASSQTIPTNSSGVASATLTANSKIGAYTVVAAASGATSAMYTITNTQGSPASIAVFSGSGQTATVGTAYANPLIVVVKDSGGNLVSGANVTFSVTSTPYGGTFTPNTNTATTNASGQAQITFTANSSAGPVTVQAAIGSLNNTFSLTNTAGAPATITNNNFTAESAVDGTEFANPLTALVKDANGNPVPGVTVQFTAPVANPHPVFSNNPTGNTSTAVTGANGVATSFAISAGSIPGGPYNVTANTYPTGVATAASYPLTNSPGSTNQTITMTAAPGGGTSVGQNMMMQVALTISPTPTSPVTVTATADGVNVMLGENTPVQSEQIGFTVGGQNPQYIYVQGLSNANVTGTITFEAPGYTTSTGSITVTPSGFILVGQDGVVPPDVTNLATFENVTTPLNVLAVQLNSSFNYLAVGQIRGGFTASIPISLQGANTAIGTVTSPITMTGGNCCATVNFVASSSVTGAASINLGTPTGFSTPAQYTTLPVTVAGASIAPQNATVGNNLETSLQFTLDGEAVCTNGQSFLNFPVTSNNPSVLLFSNSPTSAGTSTIEVPVVCGGSLSQPFYAQVVGGTLNQTLTYSVGGNGFASANGNITVGPSGFVLATNGGSPISGNFFFSTPTGPSESISVYSYLLDGSAQQNPVTAQNIAPGASGSASFNVGITSSNTSYGTVAPPTVAMAGGTGASSVVFTPVFGGTSASPNITNVAVTTVPTGFTAASSAYSSITAKVTNPSFGIVDGQEVGQNLVTNGTVSIAAQQSTPVNIMLTVSGSLLLSATGTDPGSSTLPLTIPANSNSVNYYIYGTAYNGTATYTVSYVSGGSGVVYTPRASTISLLPSGIAIVGNFNEELFTSVSDSSPDFQPAFTAEVGILNGDGSITQEALMPNASVNATLTTTAGSLGSTPGTTSLQVTIPGGTTSLQVPYTPPTSLGGSPTITLTGATGVTTTSTSENVITVVLQQ